MSCHIEPYTDSVSARAELVPFLCQELPDGPSEELWQQRLKHWWDENPHASDSAERGWVLKAAGRLVGFLGFIPVRYAFAGQPVPALIATSWVVQEGFRHAALPMALKMQRLAKTHLLLDSTPSLEVQALILRLGWIGELKVRRQMLPLGFWGKLFGRFTGQSWPALKPGHRFTTNVNDVRQLERPWQQSGRLEKWICLETLRWYAAARLREHQFLGVVDAEGCLTSYLWLTRRSRRGIHLWMLLESFSTEADNQELAALVGALISREVHLPGPPAHLLSLIGFPQDEHWLDVRALIRDEALVSHFHACPPALKDVAKHTVMAEGDFGL
ncbi:hypothetical protein [Prosthecobacter dejongeii]|uniref:Uncharacterized protein n=1 Tax=Prosthecobacter dejongeii TaxID=48465 RepID=A0A7W7YNZ0_9BACT|nr:hypothetical protein [Prosthecobacter dejongeii]MBB5039562.1 hypothetical protein [Prosthecobacter dejongeii]